MQPLEAKSEEAREEQQQRLRALRLALLSEAASPRIGFALTATLKPVRPIRHPARLQPATGGPSGRRKDLKSGAGTTPPCAESSEKSKGILSMNNFMSRRLAISFVALAIVAGCASTRVTEQASNIGEEALPAPAAIHVYPFAASKAELPVWSAAPIRYSDSNEPVAAESAAEDRRIGLELANALVGDINEMGLLALRASSATKPSINDLMIVGYLEAVERGSSTNRVLLGFGSGNAELRTAVETYQMTAQGPLLIRSKSLTAAGSRTPGLIVLAAANNPVGLIVSGGARLRGERTGRTRIEGAAEQTADKIAKRLQVLFKEQRWIP